MDIRTHIRKLQELGIETITGIPDSAFQVFCNYIENEGKVLEIDTKDEVEV